MRNGRYIPCPEPRGVTSTLWRSTVCPPEPKPIHSKVANKLATASVLPSCMYTAEFPFYSPYFADTVNNSGQMPQEPFINGKNIYVMNKTYKWLTYTSQYATYLYEGRQIPYYKHYGMIADYALNGSCGYDLTNETLTYPFGAWAFCQESYKLYARHQCSRVLVYRDIKHDGTKYKDTDLQLPTYILRKKGWKVKPDRDSNNNIIEGTGEHYVDSPTTLEPWGWHYGALTYPEWFASSPKGLPMAAPEGWSLEDYNPAECVDSLADMTDIKELSGEAIMCCLKNKARAGEITLESKGVEFLQCVPANHYHTLILECDVMYTKFGKHKLKPKGDHCLRDGYEWVENEFYNIYGSAHVLI